jgi:hypothetical protein
VGEGAVSSSCQGPGISKRSPLRVGAIKEGTMRYLTQISKKHASTHLLKQNLNQNRMVHVLESLLPFKAKLFEAMQSAQPFDKTRTGARLSNLKCLSDIFLWWGGGGGWQSTM